MKKLLFLLLAAIAGLGVQGCDPVPSRTLTNDEKAADLTWAYSIFGANYAPLDYKLSRYKMDFAALKQQYLTAAAQTQSNDEFYALLFHFVAEFRDAHTSASLTNSPLPGRGEMAYLGFSGKRKADALLVTAILPTIDTTSTTYPIKVGDKITALNGTALTDIVRSTMVGFRNLGNDESNLTYHMNGIFNRVSIVNGLPDGDDATLTVLGADGKTRIVVMPWIRKDLVTFKAEQDAAKKTSSDSQLALNGFDGQASSLSDLTKLFGSALVPSEHFTNTFKFVDDIAGWSLKSAAQQADDAQSPTDELKALRNVPSDAIFIQGSDTYPTYVTRETTSAGGHALVATIYLNTFEPSGDEGTVVTEFKNTLKSLQALDVSNVVIDLLNNGGGSLELGMQLAQALSPTAIKMPDMEMRLNDAWLDDFQKASLQSPSDTDRELSGRVYSMLKSDETTGQRLSRKMNASVLMPFELLPNSDLTAPFHVALMTNEMCASMCDIFSAILQDNKMAKIVGANTMGAGGNVVNDQGQAPNSHLELRQTESLVVRADGSYIENNGVAPDALMNVSDTIDSKYSPVRQKAIDLLTAP